MNASTSAVLSHDANVSTMSVGVRPNYLVLSAHDYRTPRRASIHFITDELAKRGDTRFFSLRYSLLSRLKKICVSRWMSMLIMWLSIMVCIVIYGVR